MNKHNYRIIFNAARGQRMAVQETARSQGKEPGASRPARRPRANQQGMGTAARLGSVLAWNWKSAVMRSIAVGAFAQVSLVSAQIVADPSAPGNQRPTVINTANGLPQVNIQTPSAAGVSRNTYSQFDVQQKGAILNNSRGNTQTQLGGWVQGNPWLAKGSARVILNEVNSSNPSQLRGYIEVAGQRAEVVVANPAGVQIDGGGFINASRATITTGVPILNGGNLEGYRVQRGTVSIEGKGFDASLTDYTGILARAVEVNGGLWANDLHVTTGANDISAASGTTPDQAKASTSVSAETPTFALDVAELGGMYAGKITLIGSEAGLGVRNAGTIGAQAGELIITAEGRLENKGTIQGKTDTRLAVADGIINSGTISAGQELAVNAGQNIGNDGGTLNARRIDISAKSLTNRNGAIEQTGTQALALNGADISNRNSGSIGSIEPASEQPSEPENPGSGTGGEPGHSGNPDDPSNDGGEGDGDPQTLPTLADGNIRVETALNNDQGKIAAATIDLTATAGLDNSGGELGVRNLEVSGGDLMNREGSLNVESLAGIHAESLNNDAGQILAAGKLDITAQDFSNRGGALQHSGKENTQFKVEGTLDNTGGVIASNAARLDVASGKLVNESGEIIHAGDAGLNIQSQVFAGVKGQIVTAGSATMQWGEADHREAKLQARQLDLKAKSLRNSAGSIAATGEGQNQIHVDGALDNSKGEIVANGSLKLNAKDVDNTSGVIASKDELEVTATDLDNTRGTLQTENGDVRLAVENGLSNNQGQIQSGKNLALGGKDISNTGTLYAKGDVDLQAQGHLANSGVIAAQGNVKLAGQNVTSSAQSLLAAGLTSNGELGEARKKLAIEAEQTASLQGQNLSSGNLGVGAVNIDLSGSQTAAQDIALTAFEAIRTAGATVSTDGKLRAEARTLDNSAGTLSADQLDLNLGSLSNRSGKVIQTGDGDTTIAMTGDLDNTSGTIAANSNNLAVKASQLVNEQGHIQHAGSGMLVLDAQSLRGKAGEIVGNGQLQLNAQAADLSQGRTVAESVSIDTSSLNNSSGNIIQTGNGQTIIKASSNLNNADGLIASNGDTRVDAGELINRTGQIQAAEAADLNVHAAKALDNSQGGTIAAGGRIALDALRVTNAGGIITAGEVAEVVAAQDIDNVGGVIASRNDLSVAASSLNNASGTIQSDNGNAALATQGSVNNDKGQIQAGKGLTLQAENIANAGTIYAQGDAAIEAKSKLENMGVIAAQGDTRLTGQNIISNAGSLLAAGLKTNGELGEARHGLDVQAKQTASLQGQNLSSGNLGVGAANIDLSGSQTAAQDISLTASEAIRTAGATVSTDGTLRAEAKALDNSAGTLSADQLDLNLGSLNNRSGKVIQTGDGDTAIAMTGDLDNTSGTIAANSKNLAVKAGQLVNEQGHIQHAGTGTLALEAKGLQGKAGEILSNGQLQLKTQMADVSQGRTVAQGIDISTGELDNRNGQLNQSGEGQASIEVGSQLDNAGGTIASNGDTRIDAGQFNNREGLLQTAESAKLEIRTAQTLDNSGQGSIFAGGDALIEAQRITNAGGNISAGHNATVTAAEAIDNTSGIIASKGDLTAVATDLDNTSGTLQTEDGDLKLTVRNGTRNDKGLIQSGKDLSLDGKDVDNTGTLYAKGSTAVKASGNLSNHGVIAAQGNTRITGQNITSSAEGLLAAGLMADGGLSQTQESHLDVTADKTASLQGQNLSSGEFSIDAGDIDIGSSQTAAKDIRLTAGDAIRIAGATVSANRTLQADAKTLDNNAGTISAGQLDLKLENLKNREGKLIQTGKGDTAIELSGDLDNTSGSIAANSDNLTLKAARLINEQGHIQHAGQETLALQAQTLQGKGGEVVSNGQLLLKAQTADLSQASTVAQRLDVDTAQLDNRGGQLIQAGNGQASIKASTSLDNAGGTIASNGDTRIDAGQIGNSNGHIQTAENASLDIRAAKTLDNSQEGSIAAGGDARIAAASVTNVAGKITAGKAAQVTADQAIDNTGGTLASKGDLTAKAASLNNAGGTVASVEGDATLTAKQKLVNQKGRIEAKDVLALTSGELDNTGGSIAASDVSVDTQKALYNNGDGTLLASNTLAIDSGKLINAKGGLIQAGKRLDIDTNGQALENHAGQPDGGIYSQGTANIATGDLLNQGAIGSQGALGISAKSLSNTDGASLTSADTLTIRADDVKNLDGSAIESLGNLTVEAAGALDNTGSLIRSSGETALSAAQIVNADTLDEGQGIEGQSVSVTAPAIDNRSGAIRANDDVRIVSSKALDNSSGHIEAGGTLSIAGAAPGGDSDAANELVLTNTDGTLIAGKRQELSVSKLEGGKVLSQGDLALNLQGDYTQAAQSELKADGDLSLSTTGTLTNQGQLQAGENIELTAKHIDNTASGEISSGNTTTLNGSDRVTNRGLIDGVNTRINTNVLDNAGTGRIYGDNIGIDAQEVVNREEYSADGQRQSATIAAREQLDIGARNVQNREGSLILSTGDLAIGQTLDAMGHATGQADLVHNASATIESGRDMTIAAATIRNSNEHFATETQQGETVTKRVIRVGAQTYDPSEIMYVQFGSAFDNYGFYYTSDDSWVKRENDDSRTLSRRYLVTQSDKYPFEIYAAAAGLGRYPAAAYVPKHTESYSDNERTVPESFKVDSSSPLWNLFGVPAPDSEIPTTRNCETESGINEACMKPYEEWANRNRSKYLQLEEALVAFRNDVGSHIIKEWVMEKYDETSYQTVVTQSDPGRIVAGGNATFNGAVINDKSQIQAGGTLTVNGPDIQNIEAEGTIETRQVGQSVHTNLDDGGNGGEREFQSSNIDITLPPQTISLPVTQVQQGSPVQPSGQQPGELGTVATVGEGATPAAGAQANVPQGQIVEVQAKVQAADKVTGKAADSADSASVNTQTGTIAADASVITPQAAESAAVEQVKTSQASNKADAIKTQAAPEIAQQAEGDKAGTAQANQANTQGQAIAEGGTSDANAPAPGVIRTVTPSGNLPTASLFAQNPQSSANYLIETDPRFTNSKQWLSSDYMLDQLGSDPALLQKRLGDGYYEQRLIREQIGQLTGLRYLQGYASDEEQYQSLMNAGVTFGKEYGLVPGVALTSAQMAQLTSDIVWLVEKQVTLADGSVQTVLAPQVYVRVQEGDLKGDGTLMAAENLNLQLSGDLSNSGTLAARKIVKVDADNIRNIGGTVSGEDVSLAASTDLENIGGTIAAQNSLSATAGRDLTVASTTSDGIDAAGSLNGIDRVASLYVGSSAGAGTLMASAGRDLSLTAANVVNDSTTDSALTLLNAGRDLQLNTEAIGQEHTAEWGKNNWRRDSQSTEVGTTVKAAGNVQLQAGQDIGMRAADIASDNAAITAIAGRDLKIEAGESSKGYAEAHEVKSGGFLSKKTTRTFNSQDNTQAEGSTLSAEKISLQAGQDVSVNASDVVATKDVNISAGRDVSISAGHDTQTEAHERQVKKSGLFGSGMGFTIGSQKTSTALQTTQETAAASTIGSVEGNVNIQAGRDYSQVGSDVLSPKGDISIGAQNIAITEAREASRSEQETKFKQSGLSVSVSAPVISAVQTASQLAQAAGKTDDTRMKALAAGAAGLNAFTSGAVGSVQQLANAGSATDAAKAANVSVSITVGSSKSQSKTTQTTDQAAGSKVQAGGDVTLVAKGDAGNPGNANSGNILVQGSDIIAAENATLAAQNQINLQSAQNLAEQHSSNKSSSAAVGVAISYGTNGLAGGITANASAARGKADGNDVVHSNSHIEAGNTATLVSGGDTNIRGAQIQGKQVIADVGGDLNIQSQQDTSVYKSKQTSVGGGITVGAGVAGSASYANSKVKGDYASVTEQSGIQAGDKGFQIDVGGNTDLKGAVIASNQTAIDNNANSLTTGTLTASDIENHSDYKASGVSLSGGYAVGGGDGGSKGKSDSSSTDAGSSSSGGATSGNGANWSWQNFNGQTGVTGAGAGYSQESGSDSSTTRSGISTGTVTVTVTDEAGQQKKAGKTADEVLANVNRNVLSGDNANSLSKNWDAEKLREQVQAQAKIVATFGETASKAVGDYAQNQLKQAQNLRQQARDNPAQADQLNAQAEQLESQWGESGSLRVLAHSTIGALTGGIPGAAGAATGTLTAPAVADALAKAGINGPLADSLTAIASTTVGAATGGASGAAAGLNEVANNYLKHDEAQKLSRLKDKKLLGQCDSSCESDIAALEKLDQQRNQELQSCHGQATASCTRAFNDVRQAAAEYIRRNASNTGVTLTYANEKGETTKLARESMGDYTVWNMGAGVVDAVGQSIDALAKSMYIGYQALTGDPAAQEQAAQGIAALETFLADPQNWPQLVGAMSPEQREQLAQAYEKGDGKAVAGMLGEQVANLPMGGGLGTVKNVSRIADKAEEVAKIAKRADVDRVVEVPAGSKGNWDPEINPGKTGQLQPKTAYVLDNGHTYITDASGRVNSVEGTLSLNKMDRNAYQQGCAAGKGCVGDDGGHLIASSLGGAGDGVNLVPQASTLNRSDWKDMETHLRNELKLGRSIDIQIDIGYTSTSGARPSSFIVRYAVDGVQQSPRVFSQ